MAVENHFTFKSSCSCDTGVRDAVFCKSCGRIKLIVFNSPYHVFNLEECFVLDEKLLHKNYLDLQNKLHPDRFVFRDEEKSLAEYHAAHLNQAYQTLKNPLKRAEYLLRHVPDDFPPEQLMEQMERREQLEMVSDQKDLEIFKNKLELEMKHIEEEMASSFEKEDLLSAKYNLLKMKFFQRLMDSVLEKMKA